MFRLIFVPLLALLACGSAMAQRQMETLNRGIVAIRKSSTQVYISWRMFGDDPADVGFNLYRSANGGAFSKLNGATPITNTTDYTDTPSSLGSNAYSYYVRPVVNGVEQGNSVTASLPANADQKQFFTVPLRTDTGPDGPYDVKFCWVGDLDGDGDYDYVVDRLSTLGANEQFLEAYTNDGVFLWRMAMGSNSVNQYAYEPGSSAISIGDSDNLTVYDMDGDGKAEVLVRTANGVSVTNAGGTQVAAITAANNTTQFLSVINGETGVEMGRLTLPNDFAAHGTLTNKAMIAYLDGKRPSVVMYGYNREDGGAFHRQFTAFDYRNGTLTQRWTLPQNFAGAEGHQIRVADVDNDGKDEICDLGHVIDDNGTQLFNTELTHGDRFHIADIDPDRPGLETYAIQQYNPTSLATALYDSGTGSMIKKWYSSSSVDVGRGIALDLTPNHKGLEMYSTQPGIFSAKGEQVYSNNLWAPEGLWWDGNLGREFIDGAGSGALNPTIDYFSEYEDAQTGETLPAKNRLWSLYNDWGSYSTHQAYGGRPAFWGDILGDWREEIVLVQSDYLALRVYTTTIPATNRLYTLMHNPQYRCQTTTKGYVQASYVDYYLGYGMPAEVPPAPMVAADLVWSAGSVWDVGSSSSWKNVAGASSTFSQGNSVLFDLTGSNASSIALSGSLSPASVSFFNPQDFVLNGSGSLSGTMSFSKSGKGTTILTGSHAYAGATTIWDGALRIDGQLTSSPVTVWGGIWGGALAKGQTGGRLTGSGTISQPVALRYRGAIAPGAGTGSTGSLTLGSSLTAQDGSVLALDISNTSGGPKDVISVAGNLNLSGTVAIDINVLGGTLTPGTYTLLTYGGSLTGSAANLSVSLPEGTPHSLSVGSGAITLVITATRAPAGITWTGGQGGNAWDLATTQNWSLSGSPAIFVANDTVTFDATGSANSNVNLVSALPAAGVTVNSSTAYHFTGSGAISGPGGLTKSGSGTLTLSTTNTYTGPTAINGGTLAVQNLGDGGNPSSIGAAGTSASNLVINGGTLALVGLQTSTDRSMTLGSGGGALSVPASTSMQISGQLTGQGGLVKKGPGTLILVAANNYAGGTVIEQGAVQLANDTANEFGLGSGSITFGGGTLSMANNTGSYNSATYHMVVPANKTGRLNADGRSYLYGTLSGSGDFTFYTPFIRTDLRGDWSAFAGNLHVISDGDGGDVRMETTTGYPAAHLNLGDNIYLYYNLTMGNNLTIPVGTLSGSATSVVRGGGTSGRTLTWQVGARNEDSVFAGVIANSTSATALTKTGTGTLALTGASTYTGATIVAGGRLLVNGSTTGSNFIVQNGGTLGGSGSVTGNVTIQSGGAFEQGGDGSTALAITGNLSFSGDAVVRAATAGVYAPGIYTVLTYTGTLSGSPTFSWEPPSGSSLTATFHTNNPGSITMTLSQPARTPDAITWTGATNSNWDTATNNWLVNSSATPFMTGDTPSFTDYGVASSPVNITSNIEPAAVIVNATQNYTFSGSGSISGTASLTKSGSGTLTVSSPQTYTGGTTIQGGTLVISDAGALSTGVVILNGGTWATGSLTPQNSILVTGNSEISGGHSGGQHGIKNVSGTGTLTLNATTGVFDLEGDMSGFSGTFALAGSGSFRFFSSGNNGSSAATYDLGTRSLQARSGAAFNLGALAGQAGSVLQGAGGGGNNTVVTYTVGGNNMDSTFAGTIVNGNAAANLVKTGSGKLTLSGDSTYTGTTTVNSGKLSVTGTLAATPVTVGSGGVLGGTGAMVGPVTCHGTLAPGVSTGTLALSAGLTLASTSTLDYQLGSTSDLTSVTGALTLDGTVNVTAASGFGPGTYTLINYTGILTDNTLNVGSVPSGFTATVNTATAGQVRLVVALATIPATVTLGDLSATYDGTAKHATATTAPAGLDVALTYDSNPTAPTTPGSYAVSAVITEPGYSGSAADTLVIEPRSFGSWESDMFTPGQILAGESAMDQDPDEDGLSNLAEYALGSLPYTFTPQPPVTLDETTMSLIFQRPAWIGDVTYHADAGGDLETWAELTLEVLNPGEDPESVRATYTYPVPKPDKQFLRLRFEK